MRAETRRALVVFGLPLTLFYIACAVYAASIAQMRLDEYSHFTQIQRFSAGDFRILEILVTTPGYHAVVAGLMRVLGLDSFAAARLISSVFGFFAVAGFYFLRRDAVGRSDLLATAQFALLPIYLLLVFMVQTDVLSLGLTLWAFWAAGRQRHWLAAAILLGAMCVRQNNVLWVGVMAWPVLREAWRERRLAASTLALLPYALVGCVFLGYWIIHGSVSISPAVSNFHPDFSLHSGNLFYMGFVGALLFALPCARAWSELIAEVRRRGWLLLLPAGFVLLYLCTFKVDHPFNLLLPPDLRDWLLMRTRDSAGWYCGFGLVAVFGVVGLLRQKLLIKDAAMFWLVTALFVSLSWLIEQRYYLIPFALFMAWRAPQPAPVERWTLALWAPLAVLLFWGMMTGNLYI